MLSLLHDELGSHVDDRAPDGLGRRNAEVQVFDLVIGSGRVQVDGLGGNGRDFAWHGRID